MSDHLSDIEAKLPAILRLVTKEIERRLIRQGHVLTGKLLRSMEIRVRRTADGIEGEIWIEEYGNILEVGVPASRVPYTPGRRSGKGSSKFIEALIGYFRTRGLPESEAKGAAFATAAKQAREGMPTRASARFSSDEGRARTGFMARASEATAENVEEAILSAAADDLQLRIIQAAGGVDRIVI